MLGVNLFVRAVTGVFTNLDQVFRISAFWVPVFIVSTVALFIFGAQYYVVGASVTSGQKPFVIIGIISAIVIFICGAVAMAIQWHRLLLLGERTESILVWPSERPRLHYFGLSFLLALIGLLLGFAVGFIVAFVVAIPLAATGYVGLSFIASALTSFLVSFFLVLLSLVLPSIAIGKPMTLSDSLAVTKNYMWPLLILTILLTALSFLPSAIAWVILPYAGPFDIEFGNRITTIFYAYFVITGFISIFTFFISVGYLSEMYREFVQDRSA